MKLALGCVTVIALVGLGTSLFFSSSARSTSTAGVTATVTTTETVTAAPDPVHVIFSEEPTALKDWTNPTFWVTVFKTMGHECIEVDVTDDALSCWAVK